MSVLEFLGDDGGSANVDCGLPEKEILLCNNFINKFGKELNRLGRTFQIPASQLTIFKMNFLYIGKDSLEYHFVFVEKAGETLIKYTNLLTTINTDELIHKINIEYGEVHWAISIPIEKVSDISNEKIKELANQYINTILTLIKPKSAKVITNPEIAKEIEAFNAEYKGKKTAFIIMQFSNTIAHNNIVSAIKETLKTHNIIGLRADDKEYSDDLFANIKTYMHCCDFGIGIFERILEDNFNPNVSIEVGYMMGLKKNVCLLKDQTLKNLPTDLMGKLYKSFDPQAIANTLPVQLEKWIKDKEII